jgi:cellulose synthase operon protein C
LRLGRVLRSSLLATLVLTARAGAFTWPDAAFHVERDLSSPDAGVRKAAADRLRTLAPGVAAPLLLKALADPDPSVRIAAAHSAITRHVAAAAHSVIEWLGDRDARLRMTACEVLGALPDPEGVAQLARALGDSEATVRASAAAALGEQGSKEATPPLLGKLDDASPAVRAEVVRSLARLGDPRAVVPLVGKAQDSVPEVRQAVARALGELGDLRAAPALVLQLRDASSDVRSAAVSALGLLRAEKAADAIAPLASDRNPLLRRVAVEALGQIASADAVRALMGLLGTGDDASAGLEPSAPRQALVSAGGAAAPLLRALLSNPSSPAAATSAAWVLGELRSVESVPDIVRAMRRGTLPTAAALHALSAIGSQEAVPVVLEFVDDPSPAVRKEAFGAAASLLDPAHPDGRAVEPLSSALRDPLLTAPERARAATLLGRTGAPRAAPAIEALFSAKDPELRLAAIDALGALGPTAPSGDAASGVDGTLLAQLDDADPAVRLHAAVALGLAGGAAARDALVTKLGRDSDTDRSSTLTALGGVMARVPSDGAIAGVSRALRLAPGPDRDALILALGRADTPAAVPALRELLVSPNRDDRRTLATVLAARKASKETTEMLGVLLQDADPSVRAEAAWSLGEVGAPDAVPALRRVAAASDPAPAIDAAGAIARILARARAGERTVAELCPLLADPRGYVRANALAGLALSGARCGDGSAERRLLLDDVASVRAAAARAIARHPLGPADAHVLDRCRTADPSGAVARLCAARGSFLVSPGPASTDAVELYVEGDLGVAPEPGAPYVVELADGLLRAGKCDRRGAIFDAAAPRGEVSLLRGNAAQPTRGGSGP